MLCSLVAGIHHVATKESESLVTRSSMHHLWKEVHVIHVIHGLVDTWTDGMGSQSRHLWSLEIKKKVRVEFDIKG